MKRKKVKKPSQKRVQSLSHLKVKCKNIPTTQLQPFMLEEQQEPIQKTYHQLHSDYSQAMKDAFKRINHDLDPQLIRRSKETEGPTEVTTNGPPLYIQEKIHSKVIINDLLRQSRQTQAQNEPQADLFVNYNGLPNKNARTEFYQHQDNWSDVPAKMKNLKNATPIFQLCPTNVLSQMKRDKQTGTLIYL